jgi:hypothetical protein
MFKITTRHETTQKQHYEKQVLYENISCHIKNTILFQAAKIQKKYDIYNR